MTAFSSFEDFARHIQDPVQRDLRIALVTRIVEESMLRIPRDTGEAASNVHVTAGAPATEEDYNHSMFVDPNGAYARSQLDGISERESAYITLLGHAGPILAYGRRLASNGKMIGSEQYPGEYFADSVAAALEAIE